MQNLEIKLNPITKLRIYREAKKIIFPLMDSDKISTDRADEILAYVKFNVVKVESPEQAKEFYEHLSEKFEELGIMKKRFDFEAWEKLDKIIALLLESVMDKWDFDLASKIMDEAKKINKKEKEIKYITKLGQDMPKAFEQAVCSVCEKKI